MDHRERLEEIKNNCIIKYDYEYSPLEVCKLLQFSIDLWCCRMVRFKTKLSPKFDAVRKEVRCAQSVCVQYIARQIYHRKKAFLQGEHYDELEAYPQLDCWLRIVGLTDKGISSIRELTGGNFDRLLHRTEDQIKDALCDGEAEDRSHLVVALRNLRMIVDRYLTTEYPTGKFIDYNEDLSWEYLGKAEYHPVQPGTLNRGGASKAPAPTMTTATTMMMTTTTTTTSTTTTSTSTASTTMTTATTTTATTTTTTTTSITTKPTLTRVMKTPPIQRKGTGYAEIANSGTVPKSRLDQLRSDRQQGHRFTRRRLQTEPTPSTAGRLSPLRSPSYATSPDASVDVCFSDHAEKSSAAAGGQGHQRSQPSDVFSATSTSHTVPRSPRLPGMSHAIRHRFSAFVKMTNCQQCDKPMFFGYKCRECKFRCHRDCVDKVPPSCGLPNELLDAFAQRYQQGAFESLTGPLGSHSPSGARMSKHALVGSSRGGASQQTGDSSSTTSSCASSAPGSPQVAGPSGRKFKFPIQDDLKRGGKEQQSTGDLSVGGEAKNASMTDSERTVVSGNSGSVSTDSEKTLAHRVGSQDSQVSNDGGDADGPDRLWPRQSSLSSREWDIPLDEVILEEKLGEGQFGVVYRGNWHGAVAVKMLNMESASHQRRSEIMATFKQEVATFRKTRHENLVLFMGACVKPPDLAIVTSLCKGLTLYRHLHYQKDKFNHNRIGSIARQICLGMGYLHARGILHKDLKTKNIFYENGKVVITDFGLFSVAKLCQEGRRGNYLTIPRGWLYYLAPELLKDLRPGVEHPDLSFSTRSDVYAFGTVFFELLTGTWPFREQPPESIIYQVAKGIKPSLANLYSIVDYKDILMFCWSYQAHDRPDFVRLQMHLERLPKRKLSRCPSQPTNMTRSNESVF